MATDGSRAIPEGERVIVGDLNGHMGISREAIERTHGTVVVVWERRTRKEKG